MENTNQSPLNLIEDVLSMKMWNFLLDDENSTLQDFVNAYDLYGFCFFSNFNNHVLETSDTAIILSRKDQKTQPTQFFHTDYNIGHSSCFSSISISSKYEKHILKENGVPYDFEWIDTLSDTTRQGRRIPFTYDYQKFNSMHILLQKNFFPNHSIMMKFFYNEMIDLDLDTKQHFTRSSIKRDNSVLSGTYRKLSQQEKSNILMIRLEDNKLLNSFIQKYIMLKTIPTNNSKTKALKF